MRDSGAKINRNWGLTECDYKMGTYFWIWSKVIVGKQD